MKRAASELEQLICVEMWKGIERRRQMAATPQSAMIAASMWGLAKASISSAAASSPWNIMELSVRYSFAPRSRQRREASARPSRVKFAEERARMLKASRPRYTASAPDCSAASSAVGFPAGASISGFCMAVL